LHRFMWKHLNDTADKCKLEGLAQNVPASE